MGGERRGEFGGAEHAQLEAADCPNLAWLEGRGEGIAHMGIKSEADQWPRHVRQLAPSGINSLPAQQHIMLALCDTAYILWNAVPVAEHYV